MSTTIDLDTELRDLLNKEQILAFFDLQFPNGEDPPVTGLCSISRPKTDEKAANYFALLFLIDTSPTMGWEQIHDMFKGVPWEKLSQQIPGIDTVLALPNSRQAGDVYCREIDIFLEGRRVLSRGYVRSFLVPAVTRLCGCRAGDIVFWDKAAQAPRPASSAVTQEKCDQDDLPLVAKVRRWLRV